MGHPKCDEQTDGQNMYFLTEMKLDTERQIRQIDKLTEIQMNRQIGVQRY